jgi:hypothetical protein
MEVFAFGGFEGKALFSWHGPAIKVQFFRGLGHPARVVEWGWQKSFGRAQRQ